MKIKHISKWILIPLLCGLLFGAARLYYHLTDDFRLSNMTYELDFDAPWKAPVISADELHDLNTDLGQKYYYIGKGAQCYAFGSADGNYVLKFFKFKHLKPNFLVYFLPAFSPFKEYREASIQRKRNKLISVFEGYDLAFRVNRKESELIYLHLVPTERQFRTVTVVDKLGLEHAIHLDDVVFLFQKKGETLRTRMTRLLQQGKQEAAKNSLSKILAMYMQEYQKGVYDRDHGVMHNTGFIGEHPFHLDVGKFTEDERMKQKDYYKKDLEHITWKIDVWVKKTFPDDYAALSTHLSKDFLMWTGEAFDPASIDPGLYKKNRHHLSWSFGN
ncbi:MAG: hypothetical protein H0V82_06725 [Candidatus Protochlamydia sp.]|nr:hypothetical protein [Candidatus Protochlamydia sp.]